MGFRLPGMARRRGRVADPVPLRCREGSPTMCDVTPIHVPGAVHPPVAAETYRAFLVARGGRIVDMVPLPAGSEAEARLQALELIGEEDVVELWAGLHAVARFERDGTPRRA